MCNCDIITYMRKKKTKRCYRCGTKNLSSAFRCSACGMVFSRAENGSNLIAKNLILAGKSNQTIKVPMFPKDVSKRKFLILCFFLGLFGAHNFYVGRYKKAVFQLICGLLASIITVVGTAIPFLTTLMSFVSFPIGVDGVFWVWDFIEGVFSKYKIPVGVDFISGDNK